MISSATKDRRTHWVRELMSLSGSFGTNSAQLIQELQAEIAREPNALLDHLRLCGAIPENYGRDSSEEKLYSKYTDAVISEAFSTMGLNSCVLDARADAADVQARTGSYSLVADAKAFRLSRTAKNQKDFKVQAMDGWRDGLDYALVVGPIYQFPTRSSQIYQQSIARNVCILSYSHLAVLVALSMQGKTAMSQEGLHDVLKSVSVLHPSKSAVDYWITINRMLVNSLGAAGGLWKTEKIVSEEALAFAKAESLHELRLARDRLLGLTHQAALNELVKRSGFNTRIQYVERVQHGQLLEE